MLPISDHRHPQEDTHESRSLVPESRNLSGSVITDDRAHHVRQRELRRVLEKSWSKPCKFRSASRLPRRECMAGPGVDPLRRRQERGAKGCQVPSGGRQHERVPDGGPDGGMQWPAVARMDQRANRTDHAEKRARRWGR
ncbi:protein of unknown function [Rhodovastum atsumiense]|nr:protein of unknown function [Rhodovastum atsumiense]